MCWYCVLHLTVQSEQLSPDPVPRLFRLLFRPQQPPWRFREVVAKYVKEQHEYWLATRTNEVREDHCQVRKGEAPRILALLNSFLLALLDVFGVCNVPRQMRTFDAQPLLALRLLLGSLLTFK
jgi:hypothetical protein